MRLARISRELLAQKAKPLSHCNAALQKKATDPIDNSRPLTDQARSHPVQRLQVQLILGLHRNAACRWPLHGLRDRVCVPEVVLMTLPERLRIGRRHLPYVMTEGE